MPGPARRWRAPVRYRLRVSAPRGPTRTFWRPSAAIAWARRNFCPRKTKQGMPRRHLKSWANLSRSKTSKLFWRDWVQRRFARRVLVIERFDRLWWNNTSLLRLPRGERCQALGIPSEQKYQSDGRPRIADIMKLLRGFDNPEKDQLDFFNSQILFGSSVPPTAMARILASSSSLKAATA